MFLASNSKPLYTTQSGKFLVYKNLQEPASKSCGKNCKVFLYKFLYKFLSLCNPYKYWILLLLLPYVVLLGLKPTNRLLQIILYKWLNCLKKRHTLRDCVNETKARKWYWEAVYRPEFNVGSNHRIQLADEMKVSVWKHSRMSAANACRKSKNWNDSYC